MTATDTEIITHGDKLREGRLSSIIHNLTKNRERTDCNVGNEELLAHYGDTSSTNGADSETASHHQPQIKSRKRRLPDRMSNGNGGNDYLHLLHHQNNNNNNNNNVKNERLSPGTPETLSRSRSVTPSSASYPGTPPASESLPPTTAAQHSSAMANAAAGIMPGLAGRNYSDFMRSLAAKYNNANPNDYFGAARNGFPPSMDTRFKTHPTLTPGGGGSVLSSKDDTSSSPSSPSPLPKKPEYPATTLAAAAALLNPFVTGSPMFPPLIDMSSTQTLMAMVRSAKEVEIQNLLKTTSTTASTSANLHHQMNNKRPHHQLLADLPSSSPLDLSAGGTPLKRPRVKTPSSGKNSDSESPRPQSNSHHHLHQHSSSLTSTHHDPAAVNDIASWTVDDVCNFVASIDICAEYAPKFRAQQIDGSGLPLLTEEHLTSTIQMKLGPALKLKSMLARKLGSCSMCLHCVHCHGPSPSPSGSDHASLGTGTGDSGGGPP